MDRAGIGGPGRANRLYWSFYPEINDPHPEMSDVYDSVESKRDDHRADIRNFLDTFEVFVPKDVVEKIRDAESQVSFCQFGPSAQPHIDGSGKKAFEFVQTARELMLSYVDARRHEEAATP